MSEQGVYLLAAAAVALAIAALIVARRQTADGEELEYEEVEDDA